MVLNKSMEMWKKEFPLLNDLIDMKECFWENPNKRIFAEEDEQAGVAGPCRLEGTEVGQAYIRKNHLENVMKDAVHIAWATGGSMVSETVMKAYYEKGKSDKRGMRS